MTTGAKIAIGCGIVIVLAGLAAIAGVVGLGFWAKGKVESTLGDQSKIDELQRKANENPFTEPADGIIEEARFVKFLEARKRVYTVYEKYKADIEAMNTNKGGDFTDLAKGLTFINELRLAKAQGLADVGMSEEEHTYLAAAVYKSSWASEFEKSSGGKTWSQAAEDSLKAAEEAAKAQAEATADPNLSPEMQKMQKEMQEQLLAQQEEMKKGAAEAMEQARGLDVPPANVALFRKYEADIKKYAMSGLEFVGL